jgi:homoserine dehydrogenase
MQLLPVRVGLVGPGLIGKALMGQLAAQARPLAAPCCLTLPAHLPALTQAAACLLQTEFLRSELRVALSVVAVANSRSMLLSADPLQLGAWQEQLAAQVRPWWAG